MYETSKSAEARVEAPQSWMKLHINRQHERIGENAMMIERLEALIQRLQSSPQAPTAGNKVVDMKAMSTPHTQTLDELDMRQDDQRCRLSGQIAALFDLVG